jgi:hypothetical protein
MTNKTIQEISVEKAIRFLEVAGAQYTVRFNGQEWKSAPKRSKRDSLKPIYQQALDALEPAPGMYTITVPDGFNLEEVRSALSSQLYQKYGKGNCITHIVKERREIEIIRV